MPDVWIKRRCLAKYILENFRNLETQLAKPLIGQQLDELNSFDNDLMDNRDIEEIDYEE